MLPVYPIQLFGKHEPTSGDSFKRISNLCLGCLRRPLLGF